MSSIKMLSASSCRVWGLGFGVCGLRFRVSSSGWEVPSGATFEG